MLRRGFVAWVLLLSLFASGVRAEEDKRIAVQVDHTGQDLVGQRFAYQLRESIRGSMAYRLEQSSSALFTIHLVTLDPDDEAKGSRTIAAITMTMSNYVPYEKGNPQTWLPIFMTSEVVMVGGNQLKSMAQGIIADFDVEVEKMKQAYSDKE